jgi:hypothetical protein
MYEHRSEELLPRPLFAKRVLRHTAAAILVGCGALGIGIIGYHVLGGLSWIDSFLNASMILGGMGPVDPLKSSAAKIFAGIYALFSGLLVIGVAGVVFAPFIHRLLHHFHIANE